ncbi:MAG: DUF3592 domain-containing protein [Rhodospirillales bacterium]|nr:DUF3592 domain-containing protein [Rhodospirillales bacterium]
MALDRSWRRISWVILGIGCLFLVGGLALGWGSLRHVLYAERADGEVIEIRREGDMYAPVLRFRLANDEMQEVQDLGTGAPDFAVGDRVTVLYMPDDPEDFRIDTFERLWFSSIFVLVFGSLWLLFGAVAWGLARGVELAVLGEGAFAVIAMVATMLGVLALWSAVGLYTDGLRAEGIVLEVRKTLRTEDETVTRSNGSEVRRRVERSSYAPVVRFTTNEGREIEFHGRGGSETSLAEGDRVTVIYDPTNPIRAYIATFLDFWLPSAAAFGVAFLFGGSVWLSRWSRRRAAP